MTNDDWMHPQRSSTTWTASKRDKPEFLIERQKVVICSFVGGGPPTEWKTWASFDTRDERDSELKRLRKTTSWSLRPAFYHPILGHKIEDEAADLRRRLAEIEFEKAKDKGK